MADFSLSAYLQSHRQELTREVPVRDGCTITVRYIPQEEMRRRARALQHLPPRAREQAMEQAVVDMLASAVVDWKGMTKQVLAELLPVDPKGLPKHLPYSRESARTLLEHSSEFFSIVDEAVRDLAAFRASQLEEERKN